MTRFVGSHRNEEQYHTAAITVPLVLHRVVKGSPFAFEDVNEETLRRITRHIAKDWTVLGDSAVHRAGHPRNWLLTFDDGYSSDYEIVFPTLQEMGMRAVFFIIANRIGSPGYLTWGQVREMQKHGMEFGSHGLAHVRMSGIDRRQAYDEFVGSRQKIEDQIGEPVAAFAFPYGDYDDDLIKLSVSAGYSTCCMSDHGTAMLPSQVIPRNSINGAMGWPAILSTLEPSFFTRLRWMAEDWTKKRAKRVLSDQHYQSLRKLIR